VKYDLSVLLGAVSTPITFASVVTLSRPASLPPTGYFWRLGSPDIAAGGTSHVACQPHPTLELRGAREN